MINLIIHRNNTTAYIPLPAPRVKLAETLSSLGIQERPGLIRCTENKAHGYDVSFSGDTEIERKLINCIEPTDVVSNVNELVRRYEELPFKNQTELAMHLNGAPDYSLFGMFQMIREHQPKLIETKFYCPITVTVYGRNSYGDADESLNYEEGGRYADRYEYAIRRKMKSYCENDECDMAEYFDGCNCAVAKLKSAVWGFESVNGTLYGCIIAKLTEPFTAEEEESFKEWVCGQNSDGLGEGFEQQAIETDDGDIFVSYWNGSDDYFIDNEMEFNDRINQAMSMGGM